MNYPAWSVATAFGAGAAALVAWNLAQGIRISALPGAGRGLRGLSGLGAFLLLPAIVIGLLAYTAPGARVLGPLTWLWPLVTLGITVQSILCLLRGRGEATVAGVLSLFNITAAWVAAARFLDGAGFPLSAWALAPGMAVSSLAAAAFGVHVFPWGAALLMPALAPAAPARRVSTRAARWLLTATAAWALAVIAVAVPRAHRELARLRSLDAVAGEAPARGALAIGLRLFGTVTGEPSPATARHDAALADSLAVTAVHIVVAPEGATNATLDSVARLIEARRDSVALIVTLQMGGAFPAAGSTAERARLDALERITRRLRPSVVLPADGIRTGLGGASPEAWRAYYQHAAAAVHRVDSATTLALATAASSSADSALVDWVMSGASPVAGVAFYARDDGARPAALLGALNALARWAGLHGAPASTWIVSVPTAPAVIGEIGQQLLVRHVLAWCAAHPWVRGAIVGEASDIAAPVALRTASGRNRRALYEVGATLRAQRDIPLVPAPTDSVARDTSARSGGRAASDTLRSLLP